MNPWIVFEVVRFELKRSWTPGRIALWAILAAFPVALIAVLQRQPGLRSVEALGFTAYFLVPEVVCLLGLMLWATPAISVELEGQTWVYLAMRRSGRSLVLLGKWLTAVLWSCSAAVVSLTACVRLIAPPDPLKLWTVLNALALLSCLAHAALYVFLGAVFYRRTLVAAVFYTLAIEFGMSFVPAVVNKLTINYRLRGLLAQWMDWEEARSAAESIFGAEPPTVHLTALALTTALLLAAALLRVARAEYPGNLES